MACVCLRGWSCDRFRDGTMMFLYCELIGEFLVLNNYSTGLRFYWITAYKNHPWLHLNRLEDRLFPGHRFVRHPSGPGTQFGGRRPDRWGVRILLPALETRREEAEGDRKPPTRLEPRRRPPVLKKTTLAAFVMFSREDVVRRNVVSDDGRLIFLS